ncbi:MAG: peptidylprolyl isomerase [Clostridia bacterium]|nr:peptidylprolyl isomerase [Clostridia bacterium]MBQ8446227.1 peptidylprolyl isomerase [Clostridia bacterium]
MFKKMAKKMLTGALAITCVFGCMGTFTACDDGNPEAQITLEFNGSEYVLNYQLYKDKTPATVNHFIWLVENEYYNGLCIHNYQAANNRMYTGAYELDENGNLDYKDYYEFARKNIKSFPQTVWFDEEKEDPLFSVYGEFAENKFNVGANNKDVLKQQYGSLTMYYHAKADEDSRKVWVKKTNGEIIERDYSENSATSMFYISTVTSATSNSSHCTFATLNNQDVLHDLEDAIADYIGGEDDDWFVTSKTMVRDPLDPIVGTKNLETTYSVPNEPIIIKSARITKY